MMKLDWTVAAVADVVAVVFGVYSLALLALLALLAWLIRLAWRGELQVFSVITSRADDAPAARLAPQANPSAADSEPRQKFPGRISLSKFQMLLWTVVLVFAWLYKLVKNPGEFPELPVQALLLMGISGAAYLGAKQQGIKAAERRHPSGQVEEA